MSDGKTETDKMWNKDDLMEVKSVQYHTEEVIERGMGASINARGEVYVRTRGESHSLLLSLKPTSVTPSKTFSGVHSPFSTRILFYNLDTRRVPGFAFVVSLTFTLLICPQTCFCSKDATRYQA